MDKYYVLREVLPEILYITYKLDESLSRVLSAIHFS